MSRKGFTEEESRMFLITYQSETLRNTAKIMGKTYSQVLWHKYKLGYKKTMRERIKMKKISLSQVELSYLAGLIDADGQVTIRKMSGGKIRDSRWKPMVSITNNSKELMSWLKERIKTPSSYIEKRKAQPMKNRQEGYLFHMVGIGYLLFFQSILPFLVIKKKRMELIIKWIEIRMSQGNNEVANLPKQFKIVQQVRLLNSSKLRKYKDIE